MNAGRLILLLTTVLAELIHAGNDFCQPWVHYKGSFYSFGKQIFNWFDGVALCEAHGAHLLEIRTNEENEWVVKEIIARKMGSVWLGSTDIFQEQVWRWVSDMADIPAVSNWSTAQPDNANGGQLKSDTGDLIVTSRGQQWHEYVMSK